MAEKNTRQLSPKELQDDLDSFAGMLGVEGYTPANSDYTMAKGQAILEEMQESETKEVQAYATWQGSRDTKVVKQWAFRDFVRNAKIQFKAQFGEDSNEIQTVGLKKKSEYKKPSRRNPAT